MRVGSMVFICTVVAFDLIGGYAVLIWSIGVGRTLCLLQVYATDMTVLLQKLSGNDPGMVCMKDWC